MIDDSPAIDCLFFPFITTFHNDRNRHSEPEKRVTCMMMLLELQILYGRMMATWGNQNKKALARSTVMYG